MILSSAFCLSRLALADTVAERIQCSESIGGVQLTVLTSGLSTDAKLVQLLVNETSLTPLGGKCFLSTRPGTRYLLCSFSLENSVRLEVYPWLEMVSGEIKTLQYILWKGSRATSGEFKSCVSTGLHTPI
jgi:hypothetical protein